MAEGAPGPEVWIGPRDSQGAESAHREDERMSMRITRRQAALGVAAATVAGGARAQERFPSRQVTVIAPFPPGASTDLVARAVGRRMAEILGVNVVIENRAGAGGVVGSEWTARQRPDGYTIQVALNATHGLVSLVNRNVPYDPFRDFTYIAMVAGAPTALVAHPSVEGRNVAEMLDWARRNPGNLQVGSSGIGSHHHLAIELLKLRTGLPFVHVPFRGGGESMNAVLGGHIPLVFGTLSTFLVHAREGRLKILAVMDGQRAEAAPEVQTVGETVPGFEVPSLFIGFVGPAGMPAPAVARLNEAITQAVASPDVRQQFAAAGMQAMPLGPDAFRDRFQADYAAFRRIVESARIQPE